MIFSVLSASGCAFKAAGLVDVLRGVFAAGFAVVAFAAVFALETLGKTDFDNTDVARDHSFHCIANAESWASTGYIRHVGLMVSIFQ